MNPVVLNACRQLRLPAGYQCRGIIRQFASNDSQTIPVTGLFDGWLMSGTQNQDIDLIDIFFYVKKRKRFILVFMVVIMTAVLLFLFANRNKVTLSNNIRINQTTPGILVSCYNENNNTQNGFVCQTAMTEAVIQ